jgi:hypothetical protein
MRPEREDRTMATINWGGHCIKRIEQLTDDEVDVALKNANAMDEELREEVHLECAGSVTDRVWLEEYCERHEQKHGEPWCVP